MEKKRVPKLCWKGRGRGWQVDCRQWAECGLHSLPVLLAQSSAVTTFDEAVAVLEMGGRGHRRPGSQSPLWALSLDFWCLRALLRSLPCVLNAVTLTLNFRTTCWGLVSLVCRWERWGLEFQKAALFSKAEAGCQDPAFGLPLMAQRPENCRIWVNLQSALSRAHR